MTCRRRRISIRLVRLSRLSSIALSALLAIGHSLCACPEMQLPRAHSEPAAHACCPASEAAESHHGQAPHSAAKPCPHCSSALTGAIEAARDMGLTTNDRPVVLATLVVPPALPGRSLPLARARGNPTRFFPPLSPERLHVSLLI